MVIWMRSPIVFVLIAAATGAEVDTGRNQPNGLLVDYYPAFCRPAAYPSPSFGLVIFGEGKHQSSVEIPLRLEFLTYANDGRALYALSATKKPICVYKIELNPVQIAQVGCPNGLATVFSFASSASGDRLLISGHFQQDGVARCGVFQIRLPEGTARQILRNEDCGAYRYEDSWKSLSMSPNTGQAVAVRRNRLELIDIGNGTSRTVADGILKAAWSPDGRWIAAVTTHERTELISTGDFRKKRTLAESEGQWSPDSRYLLRIKSCFFPIAVNGVGTVQALDIDTGKSVTVESSRCAVDFFSTGWVRSGAPGTHGTGSVPSSSGGKRAGGN